MRLQRLKQEWQECPAGTRQADSKNLGWFGEIERKLAKLSKTTRLLLLTVLPPNYFMDKSRCNNSLLTFNT
jgi:hypothetical protein